MGMIINPYRFASATSTPALAINGTADVTGDNVVGFSNADRPYPSTAQYKTKAASWRCDGYGKLLMPDAAWMDFGTGDFCIEFWMYSSAPTRIPIEIFEIGDAVYDGAGKGLMLQYQSNVTRWDFWYGGSKFQTTWALPEDQWVHIAFVRDSGTFRMYGNGVQQNSASNTTDIQVTPDGFTVGGSIYDGITNNTYSFIGYLDCFRVSNSARYTGGTTFTPFTTQPADDANTCFLLTSATEQQATPYGLTVASTGAKFDTTLTEKVGKNSLYGTNAQFYAKTSGGGAAADLGSGDFTLGCWDYPTVDDLSGYFCADQSADNRWSLWFDASADRLYFKAVTSSSTVAEYYCSWTRPLNTWVYITAERNGSTFKLYIDGVSQTLTTSTAISTNTLGVTNANIQIGGVLSDLVTANSGLNGHRNLVSIHKSAIWKGDFTPPTVDWV